ncbi:MAG: hypothetical protein R2746_17705 [Acidimicrobiales bacterium]
MKMICPPAAFVELAHGDDVLDLVDEVVLVHLEQVDRRLAGVHAGAGVGDHLDELGDRRDVELGDLLLHDVGHHGAHAGEAPEPRGHVQAGVADGGHLDVLVALLVGWRRGRRR